MKKALAISSLAMGVIMAAPVYAADQAAQPAQKQAQPTKEQQQAALDKIKADKKFIVSQNMTLTDAESKAFWPIYEEYQEGLFKLNQRMVGLIQEYAELYRNNTMTDDKAAKLLDQSLAIETDELAMKKSFVPKLKKALPATKVTRYMQIENKLRALVKFELADKIPLVK
jgi:hypothetical protein